MRTITADDLRWAERVIGQYRTRKGVDREEVRAYGLEGLVRAAAHYSPSTGAPWRAYAYGKVWHGIQDGLRQMELLTRHQYGDESEKGQVVRERAYGALRLDAAVETLRGDTYLLAEFIADPNALDPFLEAERAELREIVAAAVARLTADQQFAVGMYFWSDMNEREIAELLGVTPSAVSCRLRGAYARLRTILTPQLAPA